MRDGGLGSAWWPGSRLLMAECAGLVCWVAGWRRRARPCATGDLVVGGWLARVDRVDSVGKRPRPSPRKPLAGNSGKGRVAHGGAGFQGNGHGPRGCAGSGRGRRAGARAGRRGGRVAVAVGAAGRGRPAAPRAGRGLGGARRVAGPGGAAPASSVRRVLRAGRARRAAGRAVRPRLPRRRRGW